MPQIASETIERSLVNDAFAGSATHLGGKLASAFEITVPVEREHAAYWMWLAVIICVGAVLRFWGLGNIGLHGDEETMAMAVRHILVDGFPILPSGMFYPRGLTQLYLMAASVALFGESEWALRLPSVLCGIALIPLSYCASRRFLRPKWSLALSASVALLPTLILDSQTARMYIFLVTLVTACMACLFAWERTGRTGWLVAALAALIVGLDMHALAVATVLMFLLPGLTGGDLRRLLFGAVAALIGVIAFICIDGWVNAQYPTPPVEFGQAFGPLPPQHSLVPRDFHIGVDFVLWSMGLVAAFSAWRLQRYIAAPVSLAVVAAISVGLVLQLALFYHLASVVYVIATVVAVRSNRQVLRPLAPVAVVAVTILVVHIVLLAPVAGTPVRLVGALVGQPSVWPYVRIAEMSPYAGLATAALIAWGCYQLAHRERVTDYWLLAVLGVWAPVFALGLFAWNVPPRYTAMSLMPMLLCAFAASQRGADWLLARATLTLRRPVSWAVAIVSIATVNPTAVVAAVNSKQSIFADHKGAAEFIRRQNISEEDVLIAEDVLQQTYYLGKVDYWLVGPQVARRFVKKTDSGAVVDFYTATPVIVTTAMLDQVLKQNRGKRIFVIGSGEDWRNGRRLVREELHDALVSSRFETIYKSPDRRTRVLLAAPDAAETTAAKTATTATKDGTRRPAAIPAGMEPGSTPAMTE